MFREKVTKSEIIGFAFLVAYFVFLKTFYLIGLSFLIMILPHAKDSSRKLSMFHWYLGLIAFFFVFFPPWGRFTSLTIYLSLTQEFYGVVPFLVGEFILILNCFILKKNL